MSGLYLEGGHAPIGARKRWRFMPSADSEVIEHDIFNKTTLNLFELNNNFVLTMS